jgi:hypothetical protein
MKKIWSFALLVLAISATGIGTAKVPDLVGNWTGFGKGYYEGEGYFGQGENDAVNLTIMEQRDRLFIGNMTYKLPNGTEIVEGFAGAIGLDNKTFYIAEFDSGFDMGTIISDDEIELIYLEDGGMAAVFIDSLYRIIE